MVAGSKVQRYAVLFRPKYTLIDASSGEVGCNDVTRLYTRVAFDSYSTRACQRDLLPTTIAGARTLPNNHGLMGKS